MAVPNDPSVLVDAAVAGDRRALARLITLVEEDRPGSEEALRLAFAVGRDSSYRVGITGAPGAGKSTLTDGLLQAARSRFL